MNSFFLISVFAVLMLSPTAHSSEVTDYGRQMEKGYSLTGTTATCGDSSSSHRTCSRYANRNRAQELTLWDQTNMPHSDTVASALGGAQIDRKERESSR